MLTPKKKNLLGEAIIPGITIGFGISYFIQTVDAPNGTLFWPAATATLTGLFLIVIVLKFIIKQPKTTNLELSEKEISHSIIRPALILIGPLCYLFALPFLGFTLGSFIFMLFLFRGLGSTNWIRNFIVAAAIASFLHLALIFFMKLSLPRLVLEGTTIL